MGLGRRPFRFDPLSTHGVRTIIVRRLVNAASLAAKGAWGRELAILKKLQLRFPDDSFWLALRPAEQFESLAWCLGEYGRGAVEREWQNYQFGRAQDQIEIDSIPTTPMIADTAEAIAALPPLRKRQTAMSWSDDQGLL